jgi:uncharacterized protein YdcH (DUF465 family)
MLAVRTKRFVPKSAVAEADPRFQKVKAKIGQKAAQLKKHPAAKLKASQAQKAAKPPANEKKAGAMGKQVDAMKDAKAEEIKKDSFLELLRAEIKKVMPSTLDDADNFMEGGKEDEMKGAISGKVGEQKGEAESQIKSKTKEAPNPAGVEGKKVEETPADPAVPVPTVNAAEGMPTPRTNEEISQNQSKLDADQQFKDAQITTPQLQKARDSRFTDVLIAKKEVETVADASPAKYKAGEKFVLGQAFSIVKTDSKQGLFGLANVKTKSGSAVQSRQSAARIKDESARKKVSDNIEAMYERTKRIVEAKLNLLEFSVTTMFDNGSSAAVSKMKDDTEREIDEFKDERYSGFDGGLQWVADLFGPAPEGIKLIIKKNLDVFTATMDALVVRVADTVDKLLKDAKDEIDKGQARIKTYVSTLKGGLQKVGADAEKEISGRFDEMRSSVNERKNALAQKLAQRYKETTDKANALASEIESANEGAAYKLAKKIAEIAKLILDFKDKLVSILKKAVSVILDILSDPIGFFGNLIDAVGLGFKQFKDNFANNFKDAIAGWLFGALGSVGFELPKDLSPGSIVKLVMGVAGLTYERLRAKAVTLIGERGVGILEEIYKYIKLFITGTPEEIWAQVKEDLGSMEEMVIGGIKSWLMTSLVEAGIQKLLTMVIPGAGFVQAAIAIYKLVVFLIERAAQIAAFISSVVDSVADIVKGNISAAASRIEKALVQAMSLIIDLLARLLGLGGIADTIKKLVKKVQSMVDKAIDKVLAKFVKMFKSGGKSTGKAKDGKPDANLSPEKAAGLAALTHINEQFKNGADENEVKTAVSDVKKKHKVFKSLEVKAKKDHYVFKYSMSPDETIDGPDTKRVKITLERPDGFRVSTKDVLKENQPDKHMKEGKGKDKALVEVTEARRHIIPSNEIVKDYLKTLNGKELEEAKELLTNKIKNYQRPKLPEGTKVVVKAKLPQPPKEATNPAIEASAKSLLREFFNDVENLWVGNSLENSKKKDAWDFPLSWSEDEVREHLDKIKKRYFLSH